MSVVFSAEGVVRNVRFAPVWTTLFGVCGTTMTLSFPVPLPFSFSLPLHFALTFSLTLVHLVLAPIVIVPARRRRLVHVPVGRLEAGRVGWSGTAASRRRASVVARRSGGWSGEVGIAVSRGRRVGREGVERREGYAVTWWSTCSWRSLGRSPGRRAQVEC